MSVSQQDVSISSGGSRISQTKGGVQPLSMGQKHIIWKFFAEICMKMKEIGPREGEIGVRP